MTRHKRNLISFGVRDCLVSLGGWRTLASKPGRSLHLLKAPGEEHVHTFILGVKTGFLGNVKVLMTLKVKQNESKEREPPSALSLLAAAGGWRCSDAAWPGGAQPELPAQTPWSHPRVPRQRPAAGKAPPPSHAVLSAPPGRVHACFIDDTWLLLLLLLHACPSSLACPVCSLWWWACPPLVRSL